MDAPPCWHSPPPARVIATDVNETGREGLAGEGRAQPLRLFGDQGGGGRADQIDRGRFRRSNIRVTAICPGTVETPTLHDRLSAGGDYNGARAAFIARQPIGRIGAPEEIADLVIYLAGATYTTGQVQIIDGGWTI